MKVLSFLLYYYLKNNKHKFLENCSSVKFYCFYSNFGLYFHCTKKKRKTISNFEKWLEPTSIESFL